jgi:hypothetical protein
VLPESSSEAAAALIPRVKCNLLDGECIGGQQASRIRRRPSFISMRLKTYLIGVVRELSLVSRTKTASSFAGSVLLALRLIEWIAPGGSDQLSPAR